MHNDKMNLTLFIVEARLLRVGFWICAGIREGSQKGKTPKINESCD